MGDVSGCFSYTTLFSAHVLPDFGRYFQPAVPCVAKHLFPARTAKRRKRWARQGESCTGNRVG